MALDTGVKTGIENMGYVIRNEKANKLTIPQLKAAIELLKKKQEGASEEVKNKLGAEIVSFQIAQEKLARFADKMRSGTPQMQDFIRGKKDMYTITQLRTMNGQTTGGLDRTYQFGVGGFMHELGKQFDMKKIALGVGIAALGLGVTGMVTQAITGQGLFAALGANGALAAVGTFLTANPAALAAVIAGVSLIVARKVLPKIARAVKAHNANRRAMREAQLDMDGLAQEDLDKAEKAELDKKEENRLKGRNGAGTLKADDFGDNFAANKDKLVQALVDYGPLSDDVLKNWTTTQQSNYYTALKEAKDKKKALDDKIKEVDGTKEKDDAAKAKSDQLANEKKERDAVLEQQKADALKTLNSTIDGYEVGEVTEDNIDKILDGLTANVKDLLKDHDREMLRIKLLGKTRDIKKPDLSKKEETIEPMSAEEIAKWVASNRHNIEKYTQGQIQDSKTAQKFKTLPQAIQAALNNGDFEYVKKNSNYAMK